jgi:hypothetical protein
VQVPAKNASDMDAKAKESVPLTLSGLVVFVIVLYSSKKYSNHITYNHVDALINLACAICLSTVDNTQAYLGTMLGEVNLVHRQHHLQFECEWCSFGKPPQ